MGEIPLPKPDDTDATFAFRPAMAEFCPLRDSAFIP